MNCFNIKTMHNIHHTKILFDACCLIYIFYPLGKSKQTEIDYSNLYYLHIYNNTKFIPCVHILTISEFINRILRIEFDIYCQNQKRLNPNFNPKDKFKIFRNSQNGQSSQKDIFTLTQQILEDFTLVYTDPKLNLPSLLKVDSLDFTDKILVEACKTQGFTLLTNDLDFKGSDIDILSLHPSFTTP